MCFVLAAACDVLVLPTSTAKRYHCGVCGVLCFLSAVLCDVHLDGHREAFNEVRPISHQSPYDRVRVVNAIP